jgi:hypothetical protein
MESAIVQLDLLFLRQTSHSTISVPIAHMEEPPAKRKLDISMARASTPTPAQDKYIEVVKEVPVDRIVQVPCDKVHVY